MQRRILYVGNDMRYYFLHRHALAMAAREAGYEVHAALPGGEGEKDLIRSGIRWHRLPLKRGGVKPLHDAATLLKLYRLYHVLDPDIIHHHTIKPVIFGGLCARATGKRRVVSGITGLGHVFVSRGAWARARRKLVMGAYRFALGQSQSRAIFQNRDDMTAFLEAEVVPAGCARLIRGSGVDLAKYCVKPEPVGPPAVVLVSRMLWNKGVGEFVEAARMLKSQGCDARFMLVGDVDETNPDSIPTEQIRRWREDGYVEWMGWVEDMPSVYESAGIVCLPSKYGEGVPRSLIEAAACGRPIVTTDSPGCREIVRDGENGFLVPLNDAGALASAIDRLVVDRDLRKKLGVRGREIAEAEFSLERVIAETLAVYEELFS